MKCLQKFNVYLHLIVFVNSRSYKYYNRTVTWHKKIPANSNQRTMKENHGTIEISKTNELPDEIEIKTFLDQIIITMHSSMNYA